MVSVEATAYMIAEGLAARWQARKAKRARAAAKKAPAAGPSPSANPSGKPARAGGAQVAPAALEMVPAAAAAGAGADAAKPKAVPAVDVAADAPSDERRLTPRAPTGDVEAPALGNQARPACVQAQMAARNAAEKSAGRCCNARHRDGKAVEPGLGVPSALSAARMHGSALPHHDK